MTIRKTIQFAAIFSAAGVNAAFGLHFIFWIGMYAATLLAAAWIKDRWAVAALLFGHFLGFSWGLPAIPFFVDAEMTGVVAWIGQAGLMAFPFVLAADPRLTGWRRGAAWLAALVVIHLVPPWAMVGWGSPLLAAGWLFPGWGWIGLGLLVAGTVAIAAGWRRPGVVCGLVVLVALANCLAAIRGGPREPVQLVAVVTHNEKPMGEAEYEKTSEARAACRRQVGKESVAALGEGAIGLWSHAAAELLAEDGQVRLVCATTIEPDSLAQDVYRVGGGMPAVRIYRQRIPPPGAMWRPWNVEAEQNYPLRWGGPLTAEVGGARIAPLICYEQTLPWVVWQSMAERPDALVGFQNAVAGGDTRMAAAVTCSLQSWARLFGVQCIQVANTPSPKETHHVE